MKNKNNIVVFIVAIILILSGVAIYLFVQAGKDKNGKNKDDKKNSGDTSDGGQSTILPPSSSTTPSPSISGFPLQRGSKGENVKRLQRALASEPYRTQLAVNKITIPKDDGDFGPITEAALRNCFGVTSVNEILFSRIISKSQPLSSSSVPSTGNIVVGVTVKTKKDARGVNASGYGYYKGGPKWNGILPKGTYAGVVKGFTNHPFLGTLVQVENYTYPMVDSANKSTSIYYVPLDELTKN